MTAVAHDEAIIVSFAAGKKYYFGAAERADPWDLSDLEWMALDLAEQCQDNAVRLIDLKELAEAVPFEVPLDL